MTGRLIFKKVYSILLNAYGEQGWWPVVKKGTPENAKDFSVDGWHSHYDPDFKRRRRTPAEKLEISLGAILTQNTNWNNVVRAIIRLKKKNLMNRASLQEISEKQLAQIIRPAGYFNQKARKIKEFMAFLDSRKKVSRENLLGIWGIGRETADSILLYAHNKPFFVIDAYTRRIFSRLGVINKEEDYDSLQQTFHKELSDAGFEKSQLYNEYHALIVEHAKRHCTAKPLCEGCPIRAFCAYARSGNHGRQQKIKRQ